MLGTANTKECQIQRSVKYKGVCECVELHTRDKNANRCALEPAEVQVCLASGVC